MLHKLNVVRLDTNSKKRRGIATNTTMKNVNKNPQLLVHHETENLWKIPLMKSVSQKKRPSTYENVGSENDNIRLTVHVSIFGNR